MPWHCVRCDALWEDHQTHCEIDDTPRFYTRAEVEAIRAEVHAAAAQVQAPSRQLQQKDNEIRRLKIGDNPRQLGDYAWYDANAGSGTHPVGQKKPNPWGLYDIHGNVWEWVEDWRGPYTSVTAMDPLGSPTVTAAAAYRGRRGGSWLGNARYCRSAYRLHDAPNYRRGNTGFRLLKTVP